MTSKYQIGDLVKITGKGNKIVVVEITDIVPSLGWHTKLYRYSYILINGVPWWTPIHKNMFDEDSEIGRASTLISPQYYLTDIIYDI